MPRYRETRLSKKIQDDVWNEFCDIIIRLKTRSAVRDFFSDVLNRTERLMLIRRLQVASLLVCGFTYDEIRKLLGVGSPLIARVQRWLEFGRGGYKRAIGLLDERERTSLRKKYQRIYGR